MANPLPKEQPHSPSTNNNVTSNPRPIMSSQSTLTMSARRSKPGLVQTNLPIIPHASIPESAVSSSSVASNSQQASPILSPQGTQITTNSSSVQCSPEGLRGRDIDIDLAPTPFELPESIVSRRSSHSAMSEVYANTKSPGLIRRVSNRLTRRRQSSTHASSRDQSAGPTIVRRRSGSTSTPPDNRISLLSESDDEDYSGEADREDLGLYLGLGSDGAQDSGYTSAGVAPVVDENVGPVVPQALLQGTRLLKISRKKKEWKFFSLDIETAKVSWDKSKPNKCFWIDDVLEIRTGIDARNYREEFGFPESDEARFFSIIYSRSDKSNGRSQKTMHLIASDNTIFEQWTTTLDAISKHRHDFMWQLSAFSDKAIKAYWRREMDRRHGKGPRSGSEERVDRLGVERICRNLHIHGAVDYIHATFDAAGGVSSKHLNFEQFQDFCRRMKVRHDVTSIFQRFVSDSGNNVLTMDDFFAFLAETQKEDLVTWKKHWIKVFNKFAGKAKTMDLENFTSFLGSKYNIPLLDMPEEIVLDRPINEYFISSSHNTYLLGRQVKGESSVEPYITTLKAGCRCVEIDCWDGNDGWPIVMHGRTLTSHVSFKDVITVIKKYAFVKSQWPLWLSLEVHCNSIQQAKMAQIIKDICGESLITEPIDPSSSVLPSPSELMNRILIKVKTPRVTPDVSSLEMATGRSRGVSIGSPFIRPAVAEITSIPSCSLPNNPPMSPFARPIRSLSKSHTQASGDFGDSMSSSTSDNDSINGDGTKSGDEGKKKPKQSKIIQSLGNLGVYAAGVKYHGFETSASKMFNHIFSFSENTFGNNFKAPETKRSLVRHNMKYLMRVYPAPWRLLSTNFDPLAYWRKGVQMAALNWQTYDLGMQINEAMFAGGSDQTGYILKPSAMREITILNEIPEAAGEGYIKRERKNVRFDIDVVSAQQLMRPARLAENRSLDPYVEVEVYHADDKSKDLKGVEGEGGTEVSRRAQYSGLGTPHRRRTNVVKNNGYNPEFNKEFNFGLTTKYPDLVFVRFTVRNSREGSSPDEKGAPLATYTAKLNSLKQGYRTLPLMDGNGNRFLFSTLFVRIKVNAATSIYVDDAEAVGKFKSIGHNIGHKVFNRSPSSPKTTLDRTPSTSHASSLNDMHHL